MTTLTELFGIEVPLIQAPMAGVGTPQLAAAVTNAGALGSLGVGAMNAEQARTAIRATRDLTSGPFNVNLFCHTPTNSDPVIEAQWLAYLAPYFERFDAKPPTSLHEIYGTFQRDEAMLEMLLQERPAIVSFHFGLPPEGVIRRLREAGILLIACATNVEEARQIEAAKLDAIVAQGYEAGGHRGVFDPQAPDEQLGTLALTRLLVYTTSLPIIAAGGIMDGAGIAAALALGAQAAQLGTAFIACPESQANAAHRAALVSPKAQFTAMTAAVSGRPARGLVNGFTALDATAQHPTIPPYPYAYEAGKALVGAAKAQGNTEFAVQWAGQAARLSRPLPAAELVAVLREEMAAHLGPFNRR